MSQPFIKQLSLSNLLSFGPDAEPIELRALNVLIGPNGSGKSNLVEALAVLRATSGDLALPIRKGGGVDDWLHRGQTDAATATIEAVIGERHVASLRTGDAGVVYRLTFGADARGAFEVRDERLENEEATAGQNQPVVYFGYEIGEATLLQADETRRPLRRESLDSARSIFSQRKDAEMYPELTRLAELLGGIAIYREWTFGPSAAIRGNSLLDGPDDRLTESLDNLALRLEKLCEDAKTKRALLEHLKDIAPGFNDITFQRQGNSLRFKLTEGERNIPAHRLSDGTLRYLALLAILLDPAPPPLVVIEEPELGLHFDVVSRLARLLEAASERMQLVITTHSDMLVDALSHNPEAVVVCEKPGDRTELTRLDGARLATWLEDSTLGELWSRGHLGGTRW